MLYNTCSDVIMSHMQNLGIITLNRPQKFNALNESMFLVLEQQLLDWAIDPDIHAVIIRSNSKVFCAGGDIRDVYVSRGAYDQQIAVFAQEYRLDNLIHNYPKPYIAWMNGITFGGGVGLALHGSHPVATENFLFAMPEANIGFFPDVGSSYLFNRCPGQWGKYLGLSGQKVGSYLAKELGLIKYTIQHNQWSNVLAALLEEDLSQDAHSRVTNCLQQSITKTINNDLLALSNPINECFAYPTVEEIINAIKQHNTSWSNNTLKILSHHSPTSLKVTLKQLTNSQQKTLAECLDTDLILVENFLHGHDFYEGIRAAVIDKDQKPSWQPQQIHDVSNEQVDSYFEKYHAR